MDDDAGYRTLRGFLTGKELRHAPDLWDDS
jgi:hypothetical protein